MRRDLMEARGAAALTLQHFDENLRRMGVDKPVGRLAGERRRLARNLSELGGVPWRYSPSGDNSWVPG